MTFSEHIAPLVLAKCAPCHRPGEAGPFDLLTYDDVASRAQQILDVTARRFMPPWRPVAGYAQYANDRSLTTAEMDLILRWVKGGARLGDASKIPLPPVWPSGWQLGEPDVVVQLTEAYALAEGGGDVYRNFVIPSPVARLRYVKAWEFRPGSRTIHHAILNVDRFGIAQKRDAEDREPGFGGMDVGDVQSADGFYLVWTPGKAPARPDPSAAWRLDPRSDLVLQLHMQPTGKPEVVRPSIGLFFADRPPTQPRFTMRVGDPPIDIPPGEKNHVVHAEYVLPADVNVMSVFPHAHYLATKVRSWATLPDHSERGLLRIDDWDFNWQDAYTFAEPLSLPRGSTVSMEITYDNSERNVRNPSHPPKRVTTGESSTGEMGNLTFEVVPRDPKDMQRLRESKYRRLLAGSETAKNHYNLANVLAEQGLIDEAILHYRRATALNPSLAQAHFNLGNVLRGKGQIDEAIAELREAVRAQPDHADAHVNLGNALKEKGNTREALEHYAAAVASDPRSALAHNSLGLARSESGDAKGAIDQFRAAIAIEPDNWASRFHFGNALRANGDKDEAIVQYRRALALRPDAREAREALDALLAN